MGKKYTTDTLSATEGIYGKQLFVDTGETIANIVSYTDGVINQPYSTDDVYWPLGDPELQVFDFFNNALPTVYVGNVIIIYNSSDNSPVSLTVTSVSNSDASFFVVGGFINSGTPSGSYDASNIAIEESSTNIITDTDLTGILNSGDYVFLGVNQYLINTVTGNSIVIGSLVSNIANIPSIQSFSDFPILNYRSVLANGNVVTAPIPVYFNTSTFTSNLLGIKLATNDTLDNFFVGEQAGSGTRVSGTVFIGTQAGKDSTYATDSLFIGGQAGFQATYATQATFIGGQAGYESLNCSSSIYVGNRSGYQSSNGFNSFFLGSFAGGLTTNVRDSIMIGFSVGYQSSGNNVIAFGRYSARNNSGNNVVAIGPDAGRDNSLSGKTIFSNTHLPTYSSRSAATTAITVANGASAGDTFLYYNSSNFQIEGVRL